MTKIYIDDDDVSEITEIAWLDKDGDEEYISLVVNNIGINTSVGDVARIFKQDIPKLIKALNKAEDLGWWKDE